MRTSDDENLLQYPHLINFYFSNAKLALLIDEVDLPMCSRDRNIQLIFS